MVATFCIYSQVQDHEFINFDDDIYITNNLNVQAGLTSKSVLWAFTNFDTGSWFPVTWFSHILDYQLYGLHAKGHHLTSLFLHIANALILFIVLSRMTGKLWQSGFVAAMFAFHPLNVESVAWAAERKNVLSTLFWLMTMWAYIHYAEKPTVKRYGLVFLFFTLGLMSKPMLVTLPFVLLLLDYWPLVRFKLGRREREFKIAQKDTYFNGEKNISKLVLEKFPLLILSALCSITTLIFFEEIGGPVAQDPVSILAILTNVMISYFEYLWKMLWPKGLAILYAHPGNTLAVWKGVLCGIALLVITTISIKLIRKAPYFVVGWFWYLGTLIPVIGFIPLGGWHLIADRYAYLPLIGIFVIIAWGVPELLKEWHYRKNVLTASAGILILTLMLITWIQVSHWKSSITVFKHAIRVTDKKYPGFSVAHNNLGIALVAEGKNEEAISHYKMAIKIKPDFADAYNNLGNALLNKGRTSEAISHYKMAIKLNPDFAEAHNNLGIALFHAKMTEEAIDYFKEAIRIRPGFTAAQKNLEMALLRSEELE